MKEPAPPPVSPADDPSLPHDAAQIAIAAKDRHTAQGALARHVLALSARFAAVEARDAPPPSSPGLSDRVNADMIRRAWQALGGKSDESAADAAERYVAERATEIDALRAKLSDETQRRVNAESHRDVAVAEMAKLKADLAAILRAIEAGDLHPDEADFEATEAGRLQNDRAHREREAMAEDIGHLTGAYGSRGAWRCTLNDLHRAYRDPLSVPCVLCHAPVGAACVDVPEYVTRLDANGIHPLRPSDAMRAARRAWLDVLELEDRLDTSTPRATPTTRAATGTLPRR